MEHENITHIIDAAGGRDAVIAALGIKLRVLQHHIQHGQLPAKSYLVMQHLVGGPLPDNLFSFDRPQVNDI